MLKSFSYVVGFLCLQILAVDGDLHAQPVSFFVSGESDATRRSVLINNRQRTGRPLLTVSPDVVPVRGDINATWSGIATPTSTDWIGLYEPGSASSDFIDWIYVSCSKTPEIGQADGSCPFIVPVDVNPGDYELRLLANDGFTLLATSTPLRVLSWCPPVNIGETVNSPFQDFYPSITPNGLSLYFESDRPGGAGGFDIWVSRRQNLSSPWQTPQNLGPLINGPLDERVPSFTPDGLTMYLSSERPQGFGGLDIYVTTRMDPNDDFGWGPVENLGAPLSTEDILEGGVTFQLDAEGNITHLYFIRHPNPNHDILVSVLGPSGWETPVYVAEVNTEFHEVRPLITSDGLRMFLTSARPEGFGLRDLYVSTRASVHDPWGPPVNLGPNVNTAFRDENGSFDFGDPSENTLYLHSNRSGGSGMGDIHVTTRTCPMLTVSPSVTPVGGEVTGNWSGIATPTSTDWIGLYAPGSADTAYIDRVYVSCFQIPNDPQSDGSCRFFVPPSVNPGDYELRLFANDGFTPRAISNPIKVE
jgi:hypothetical protein